MDRRLLTTLSAALILSCLVYQASAQAPVAVPTPSSDLSEKRDAYDDAYSGWNKVDIGIDSLRKLKPADALKRLDDAQRAAQRLQKARQQYHAALRIEYQRLKRNLEDSALPSADTVAETTKFYDAAISLLADDSNTIDAQMPASAADGASIVYQQGLKQAKEKISSLQLTLLKQRSNVQRTAETARDAAAARQALTPHVDALLKNLDTYDQLDADLATDTNNLLMAYRSAVTAPPVPASRPQPIATTSSSSVKVGTLDAARASEAREAETGAALGTQPPAQPNSAASQGSDVKAITGDWVCGDNKSFPGKIKPKSCSLTIRASGDGTFSADFRGVSNGSFMFDFHVTKGDGAQFEGKWTKGLSSGSVTIERSAGGQLFFGFATIKDNPDPQHPDLPVEFAHSLKLDPGK